jgi:hypothetical protein
MFNEDVIDLYQRCPIGTRVLVLKHLGAPVIDEQADADRLWQQLQQAKQQPVPQ